MKKEYLTARLFRNRSVYDMNTEEGLQDSYQKPSTEDSRNSTGKNETADSSEKANNSSLPQRILELLQKTLK